jgi:thymidylate kinase
MIIELFGPPGVGKTTLAHVLTSRLQQSGHLVDLTQSCRPAEQRSSPGWITAVPRRLSRPLLELLAIAGHPFAMSHDIGYAATLLKILPPGNMATAMRFSQYILRLSHCWYRASAVAHIVLFDQAFIQLICSLALLCRAADESLIARALDCSPRSDLLIRLDAPLHMLAARLQDRERRQSAIERRLELNLNTNLKSIGVIDQLERLLLERGQPVIRAISADQRWLSESVDAIEKVIMTKLGAAREGAARPRSNAINPIGEIAT